MKYNLKNRPDKDLLQPELWQWKRWAEGLEAELRGLVKEFGQQPVYLSDVIKEILGEEA